MPFTRLARSSWHGFFDDATRALQGRRAEIEVSSPSLGNQVLAERLPLLGIAYDDRSDVMEILLDGFDHRVHHPVEMYVDGPPSGLATLTVVDGDGVLQVVSLEERLLLTAGAADRGGRARSGSSSSERTERAPTRR